LVSVNPPTDLQIIDPGHLGQLYVRWHPPASLENRKDCTVRYQLQYFNTYDGEWETIRTSHLNYTAQFNLGKETRVKVQTLLRGQCVNGTDLLSVPTEKTLLSSENGPTESKVTDFACIFYHREYMECNWKKGKEAPPHSKYSLFYWHKKMNQAMECPKYIQTNGVNTGCNFTSNSLMEFTEFNICVNGSLKETPLRPTYFMLQLQNIVKPAALEILNITALENAKIRLKWTPIKGKIPNHCLEYEIQHRQEGQEWIVSLLILGQVFLLKINYWQQRKQAHNYIANVEF
ncbi:I13R2 protein, partial [Amia calva]|nr:I13R2 protein [Amia calva]